MNSVFVDTDVVLDLFLRREPHHGEALRLFSHLKRSNTRCFTSPIVMANAYYLLSKMKNKGYALDRIRRLRRLVSIASVNESTIDAALERPHKDFEDSIQYHCALSNGIKTLVTRNAKDFLKAEVDVANPTEYRNRMSMERRG
jgi:predicted nucleic acid-binding protein